MRPAPILALMAVLAAATPAPAAQTRFLGAATIVAKAGTCPFYDPVGDRFYARFRPAGVGTNGPVSGLSFFKTDGAQNYALEGRFGPRFQAAETTLLYDTGDRPERKSRVRFLRQEPATITPRTDFVTVVGEITDYDYMEGCTVTIRMALARRVES